MPLQSPTNSAYNPYQEPQKPRNWPLIILIAVGVIIVIGVGVYIIFFNSAERWVPNENLNNSDGLGDNNGIAVGESNPSTPICDDDEYNCGNFTTQSEAQIIFDACFKNNGDIHRLDADGNGKACESLAQ